jgi:hypothetical protein
MFARKNNLTRHKKRVHNIGKVESFECDVCKKIFKMKESLVRHTINVHLDFGKYPMQHTPSNI